MTQDEVDLIYDYLHENYEYVDGEFFRKKEIHGSKVGRKMGCVKIHPEGNCYMVGSFSINGKQYNKRIAHLVYLYHLKEFPEYVLYVDGNKANTRIENIKKTRLRSGDFKPHRFSQGGLKKFRVNVVIEGYTARLGTYLREEEAFRAIDVLKKYAEDFSISPQEIEEKTRSEMGCIDKNKAKERSLPLGVDAHRGVFRARMRMYGKKTHIGYFDNPEEAHQAYLKAKEAYENTKTLPTKSS